ncbi:MAG: DUF6265 family protein [Sediminicola sp.]|tara:strand:- start:51940 stop:52434 length:495 start_codon:yes stop_codon:yes gene_type:complete
MSRYFPLLLLFLCCKETRNNTAPSKNIHQDPTLDWLVGSWARTNDDVGNSTYEHWKKVSDTEYMGLGCTLQKKDTVWQEIIRLVKRDGKWSFGAKSPQEDGYTIFPLIRLDENGFICGNDANEFPKRIAYQLSDSDHLKAVVSGGGPEIRFEFERISPKGDISD